MSDQFPNISYDGLEFEHFCNHINSRLCVSDFVYKTQQLGKNSYDPNKPATLVFWIRHGVAVKPLFDSDYSTLITNVCSRIEITPYALDSFRSELDDLLLEFFVDAISKQKKQVSVQADPSRPAFLVQLPDLLSDLILSPLSQIHLAIVSNCHYFAKYIEAVGGDPKRLFLNAHASSACSMFLLTWVANLMHIPLKFGDNNTPVFVV